jgi:hypothetical protein
MMLFPSLSLPLVYRFRPLGMDPARCMFEMLLLRPLPKEGPTPPSAQPFHSSVEDSYTTVPGMDFDFGTIYDQDTNNMRMQQEVAQVSLKRGQTLSNYQECRIRKIHQVLDKYL